MTREGVSASLILNRETLTVVTVRRMYTDYYFHFRNRCLVLLPTSLLFLFLMLAAWFSSYRHLNNGRSLCGPRNSSENLAYLYFGTTMLFFSIRNISMISTQLYHSQLMWTIISRKHCGLKFRWEKNLSGFSPSYKGTYSRLYRIIAGDEFLANFASDRSHMIRDGEWISPPPSWPLIQTQGFSTCDNLTQG